MPEAKIGSDACAACALHLSKNDTNSSFVSRYITERIGELVDSPNPEGPFDILARAHAMLLYQVIAVFGGDVSALCLLASLTYYNAPRSGIIT
jgi:hypothetical protein